MDIISLNIYKKNADGAEECIKEYTERDVRWGVIEDALELQDRMKDASIKDQIKEVKKLIQAVFPDLTEEHMRLAYNGDLMNIFEQIKSMGSGLFEAQEKNGEAEGSK